MDPAYVYGVSRGLISVGVLDQRLGDGMVICACLPMTISSVTVMTKASKGDEGAAVFNCAFGNFLGVFVSPLLIFVFVGAKSGELDLGNVLYKLTLRVLAPVAVGQMLQKRSPTTVEFMKRNRKKVLKVQLYILLFIVYTVFCQTFASGTNGKVSEIFVMIALLFVIFCCLAVLSWASLKVFFNNQPKLRVMGLFGCTQKTVSWPPRHPFTNNQY